MNRRRHLMLLAAPLLASTVAFGPAHAAQAGTAGTTGAVSAVKVTKVEVVTLLKSGETVECNGTPVAMSFDGKITATGPGAVRYHWTVNTGRARVSPGTFSYGAGTSTKVSLLVADVPAPKGAKAVTGYVTLHLPDQKKSVRSEQVTFPCKK
ncbi:hypothetical protein [Streptomyces sp. NRRL S-87]|uniref:hypothetical protein n=1 Tax=Streptomyces sp. NRRL S-87 TaxID=1463920 RepID=UPI0004BF0961|nr:hypothetical protein [Streptomyces sp. NRRL S-87]